MAEGRLTWRPGPFSYALIGVVVAVALTAAWQSRLRRRGAQVAADEARMEPTPVVY
jgi:hypothetical protein